FLDTFLDSFSSDSQEKLSYFLKDKSYKKGLAETMDFVDVNYAKFYKGESDKEVIVDVNATFLEPISQMEIISNYLLVISVRDSDEFTVDYINNDEYILDLIKKR